MALETIWQSWNFIIHGEDHQIISHIISFIFREINLREFFIPNYSWATFAYDPWDWSIYLHENHRF